MFILDYYSFHFMIITEIDFFFLIEKDGILNVKYPEYGAGKLISSFMG